ncbi:MAG: Trm112 family protein [Actinobacteria bacterium]|nr:Trm112 family protein [Actinomycetota bacterium]
MAKLNQALLQILACPCEHHASLNYQPDENELVCQRCATVFEVRDGIPIMLLSEAKPGPNGIGKTSD